MKKGASLKKNSRNNKANKSARGASVKKSKQGFSIKKIILYAIIVLAVIAGGLFLFETGAFNSKGVVTIDLEDRCGILFDSIIHHIKDEQNCKSLCRTECNSQELNFLDVTFESSDTGCHTCTCRCM